MQVNETLSDLRAREILKAYGGDPLRWPVDERAAMERAIATSVELQVLQQEAASLDHFLGQYEVQTEISPDVILGLIDRFEFSETEVPFKESTAVSDQSSGWLARALDWLVPPELLGSGLRGAPTVLWRGALAATVPVAVGIWLGGAVMAPTDDWSDSEQLVFAPFAQEVFDG